MRVLGHLMGLGLLWRWRGQGVKGGSKWWTGGGEKPGWSWCVVRVVLVCEGEEGKGVFDRGFVPGIKYQGGLFGLLVIGLGHWVGWIG